MRLLEIKRGVDEVQELDKIVDNGGSLYTLLARIHEWADEGENPFSYKRLINLAEEESL